MHTDFLIQHLDIITLLYGLSFFITGTVIFTQKKVGGAFRLADMLAYFGLFCLIHAANGWVDMWLILKGPSRILSTLGFYLLSISFVFLFEFGRRLCALHFKSHPLLTPWTTAFLTLLTAALPFASAEDPAIWTRYFLALPGGLLSCAGLYFYYRDNEAALRPLHVRQHFFITWMTLGLYALFGGLVVPAGNFFPASLLSEALFLETLHIPVQVLSMLCALTLTAMFWKILGIFYQENTERLRQELSIRQSAEEELLRKRHLDALGTLAGGIAHDFNNLLTGILGNLSLLKESSSLDAEARQMLSEIEGSSRNAKTLSHQLITFAKGGSPVVKFLDLRPFLREASVFPPGRKDLRCAFDITEDIRPVDADANQLRQVLSNLLLNAALSMPNGGTVYISARNERLDALNPYALSSGDYILIRIRDEGIGLSQAKLAQIFDPYFIHRPEGGGLGLAICHSIIRKHKGHILAESQPGKGTAFTIILPTSRHQEKKALAPVRVGVFPRKILIMDDESAVRNVASRILQDAGYAVETAEDGGSALEKYRVARDAGRPFGCVILDLTVPNGMGGKDAIPLLKELDPELNAVVSSGYSEEPVLADYERYGFRASLSKPYEAQELLAVVSSLVR
ncbi:MAG: ATP-binding protein [Elusimicrobiota bacterium]|jgi:signal transduction histidine kinase/CheY-like chemotaxis protein